MSTEAHDNAMATDDIGSTSVDDLTGEVNANAVYGETTPNDLSREITPDDVSGDTTVVDVPVEITREDAGESNGRKAWKKHRSQEGGSQDEGHDNAAIDLVLREIGVHENHDDSPERRPVKQLSFAETNGSAARPEDEGGEESCSNPVYRYKILDTVWLFWNVTTMGWIYGQMGPALPDLQIIGDVKLQEATWLFTGFAIGYLSGCLLAGLIQEKFNPRLMLFLYTTGTAVTIGLLPWIPNFIGMVIIRVFNGFAIGGQDTGLHSMLFATWAKDGGPFIQMTHVLSAVGGILSPLITQPFLMDTGDAAPGSILDTNNNTTNTSMSVNTTSPTAVDTSPNKDDTNVQYAFLITAILTFSAALPFLVAILQKRRIKKTIRQYSNDSVDRNKLPKKIKVIVLVIMCSNSFIATANIDLFPSFLTTFVMQQLGWSQQSASSLTSLYFGTYAAGNFVGVFILAYISSTTLITFSYITSTASLTGLLLSVIFESSTMVWMTVAFSGVCMSAILPTLFTWTQENVTPISGRIASCLLISGSAGVMVNPILLGYMMEGYTPMWFLYLSLGEIVLCGALFTSAFLLSKLCRPSPETTYSFEPKEHDENISDISSMRNTSSPDLKSSKTEIYARGTLFGI